MKKQVLITIIALIFVATLFYIGKTTSSQQVAIINKKKEIESFDIQSFIRTEVEKKAPSQQSIINRLENDITQSNDITQKKNDLEALALYCKDSINLNEGYLYFTSEAAKLDNSEKNLTFAARLFLNTLRGEENPLKLEWESSEAIVLFEKAIALNGNNDDLRIGLGSCYVFGKGRNGDPQQTMKGIQELLGVIRKDSNNMKAQLVLGIGGYISGQYDKAVARLSKVIIKEPSNLEAIAFLADTYAAKGDVSEAIKWYNVSKRLANDEHYSSEVDERIKQLQK